MRGVVLMEGLVDEAGPGIGSKKCCDAISDFIIVSRGKSPHHYGHGPDHIVADMGASDSLPGSASEETWVVFAQDKATGVLPHRVRSHFGNKISKSVGPESLNIFCLSYDGENAYLKPGSTSGYRAGTQFEIVFFEYLSKFVVWFSATDFYEKYVKEIFSKIVNN